MKRPVSILFAAVLLAQLTFSAFAAQPDRYIVRLVPAVMLQGTGEDLRPLCAAADLYLAEDAQTLEALDEAGLLLAAEPDQPVMLDDLPEESAGESWHLAALHMDYAVEHGITGAGVRVGLVDSGVMADHPYFADKNLLDGANYCSGGDPDDISDSYGHGTFAAGLILDVAPEAELVPLKCFEGKVGTLADVIAAVSGGVDDFGCDVINLSLGLTMQSDLLSAAVGYAYEHGVTLMAAVGNNSKHSTSGPDRLYYPAAYDEVIGVGSVDEALGVSTFSSRNESVLIAAPGTSITAPALTGGVRTDSGTSFSSPLAAGAAALVLSQTDMAPEALADLLAATSLDLGEPGYDTTYGYGLLDVSLLTAAAAGDRDALRALLTDRHGAGIGFFEAYYNEEGAMLPSDEGAGARKLFTFTESYQPVCLPIPLPIAPTD